MAAQFAKLRTSKNKTSTQSATPEVPQLPDGKKLGFLAKVSMMGKSAPQLGTGPVFPEEMQSDCVREIAGTNRAQGEPAVQATFAVWSHAGSDPGGMEKENQDAWAIHIGLGGQPNLFLGVFDGHGVDGTKISSLVARTVPRLLSADPKFKSGDYEASFTEEFLEANQILKRTPGISAFLSGTTSITALLRPKGRLLVANVGDSRAVLGRVGADGHVTAQSLSMDHSPEVPAEAERIQSHQGRICSFSHNGSPIGPLRIWLPDEDVPGLSMTRAFGDIIAAKIGLIAKPDIRHFQLRPEDRYLVLMSDGVYEFTENEELMQLVHNQVRTGADHYEVFEAGATALSVAKFLVSDARRRWAGAEEGACIDDCTCIVVLLKVPEFSEEEMAAPDNRDPALNRPLGPSERTGLARLSMSSTAQALARASKMAMD